MKQMMHTFNNYNLISIGHFNPNLFVEEPSFGQITSYGFNNNILQNVFKAGQDIIGADQTSSANSIAKKIKYNESFNNSIVSDFTINWLRLTIESEPYLIIEQNGVYRPYDDVIPAYIEKNPDYIDKNITRNGNIESIKDNEYQDDITSNPINYPLYQIESTYNGTNVYLGWLFEINNQSIIISPPNNVYQFKENDFSFKKDVKIIPAKDTAMLVDYRLTKTIREDTSKDPKVIRTHKVNSQLIGVFDQETELISRINYKYKYTYQKGTDKVKRAVNGVRTVLVDTEPGAIIKLKTSAMEQENRFIVNETGELNFDPNVENINITSLKIVGINIPFDQNRIVPQQYFNLNENQTYSKKRYLYEGDLKIEDEKYYYYHNLKWYPAFLMDQDSSLDIYCPIDASVFYFAIIEERIY